MCVENLRNFNICVILTRVILFNILITPSSSKRWRTRSRERNARWQILFFFFYFKCDVNAIFCSKLEDSEDESCERENCATGRPAWREEAHQTIYWDKLNGRQSEVGARKQCAWTTSASWFRHRRFSARDIKRRREGWVEDGDRGSRTRLRLTHSPSPSPSPPVAPSWAYFFFICNIMHQNTLFFKNVVTRYLNSIEKEKRK